MIWYDSIWLWYDDMVWIWHNFKLFLQGWGGGLPIARSSGQKGHYRKLGLTVFCDLIWSLKCPMMLRFCWRMALMRHWLRAGASTLPRVGVWATHLGFVLWSPAGWSCRKRVSWRHLLPDKLTCVALKWWVISSYIHKVTLQTPKV